MIPETLTLVLMPVLCAFIGWLTNYIAVKMIFRPYRPVRIVGLKIQGLMPRRQSDLARKIGETVEDRLLTHDDLNRALNTPQIHERALELLGRQVDLFFQEKLKSNPMVAMFLQGEMAIKIKRSLVEQIESALPDFMEEILGSTEDLLDVKAIVQQKIEEYDLSALEEIVYNIASKELKLIVVLGGVLGFLVGLIQVGLILLTGSGS